jgi:hypothetical protein
MLIAVSAWAQSLPVTPVESLTGQKLSFPSALAGKTAVCVFGFTKEAGDHTKDWMIRLNKDGVNAWSVANLESAPSLIRGMIRSSMRKGTPEAQQGHSLVMTKDGQAWKKALEVKQESLPVVVVFDASGKIAWKQEGTLTEDAYRELRKHLP